MTTSFDPNSVDLPSGHFIGGTFVSPAGQDGIALRRPSDGQYYVDCPIAPPGLVDEAVRNASAALTSSGWGTSRPRGRVKAMHAWADLIVASAPVLARIEAVSSSRPIAQIPDVDIAMAAEQIRFFAEMADKEGGDVVPTAQDHLGMILTEPYGVIGAITPWNFPLLMAVWKAAPALAAGNAVVLKPSELTPFSTLFLADLAVRAGLPAGLFNVVLGDGPVTGQAITGHAGIGKVSFTGSTLAGEKIMENIARTGIKPMTLELGGKSPQIVFADADLELAADIITRNIIGNAGQVCVAGSRLIVDQTVAQRLTALIVERMQQAVPGPTWNANSSFSPIISARQLDRITTLVDAATKAGARTVAGGQPFQCDGYFYAPTLLTDLDTSSPAIQSEIFGPVLSLQSFQTEEEAIALASHPTYGLAAGVFTRDLSRAIRMTRRLEAGTVWVNRYGRSWDHILPTGGFKSSGIGQDLGRAAYRASRRNKSVLISC